MTNVISYLKDSLSPFYKQREISAISRFVLEKVLHKPYPIILMDKNKEITSEELQNIDKIIDRLKQYEPIQYILGETEFCGLPFYVDANVLIPRPETEELVELICQENENERLVVLDIGTGSGCISISLAKWLNEADLSAWEVSESALQVAEKNALRNQVKVDFRNVEVLSDYPLDKCFDIIVSNPPYVLESDKKEMEKNVLSHEPHLALFVPDDKALIFYERIAEIAQELLKQKGQLYFEIHYRKGNEIVQMLQSKGYREVKLFKDLSGNDRMVRAIWKKTRKK